MTGKTILCRCEDVSESDVRKALDAGYRTIEEIKRYTGFGTGTCQGKECLALIASTLVGLGQPADTLQAFTSRSPLAPTPLKLFAADHRDDDK